MTLATRTLDLHFVRHQFSQLDNSDGRSVFCSNAGGSFVANQVNQLFEHYNRFTRVQPYSAFSPSREAGEAMDRAKKSWAEALNINSNELTIGPSTSINSYVMAHAAADAWGPGDEIIVTQQDHEANHGIWRRLAEQRGATVIEWPIEKDSGLLDPDRLYELLNEKTRWVFFTHCSNLVGTVNPVKEITTEIKRRSAANVCVDGVAYAPHHIPDLKDLGVDMYLFSLYKVFGPHQGVMYVNAAVQDTLTYQSHQFLKDEASKRYNPAGPQHAEVAAAAGVLDYFHDLLLHHNIPVSNNLNTDLQQLHTLVAAHENTLAAPILDFLHQSPNTRLLGKFHCSDGDRAPTIAFKPLHQHASDTARALQQLGIGTENGDFYAHRVVENTGTQETGGVVRISLVHYNTSDEVNRIISALDQVLA